MKTILMLVAAGALTTAPKLTTFDPDKTAMLSGFIVHCPPGLEVTGFDYRNNQLQICKGVFLETPTGREAIFQRNMF